MKMKKLIYLNPERDNFGKRSIIIQIIDNQQMTSFVRFKQMVKEMKKAFPNSDLMENDIMVGKIFAPIECRDIFRGIISVFHLVPKDYKFPEGWEVLGLSELNHQW